MSGVWQGWLTREGTALEQVTVRPADKGLELTDGQGSTELWPYTELLQSGGRHAGEPLRFARGGSQLQVADALLLKAIHRQSRQRLRHLHHPGRGMRWLVLLLALILGGFVLLLLAAYFWALPALSERLAQQVPPAWEARLGRQVVGSMAAKAAACQDARVNRAVDGLVQRLASTVPNNPYTFRVLVLRDPQVNALAAPGGYMVVYSGLLEKTRRPEELAGVLAHEMQHVLQQHSTKAILRQVSGTVLLSAVLGDLGGAQQQALEIATQLGDLRYSRQSETAADLGGLRMLQAASIDPRGLPDFFGVLEQSEHKQSGRVPAFLSSHPETLERIRALEASLEGSAKGFTPLQSSPSWTTLRGLCSLDRPPE